MGFGLVPPYFFVFSFFNNTFFMWCQMIVVTWGVSLAEMSSCIVMPIMKAFIKKSIHGYILLNQSHKLHPISCFSIVFQKT